MLAIFKDAFDLHRALNGYDTNLASFVDALQAEWTAGGWPGRKEVVPPPKKAPSIAEAENAWSHKTRRWADLKFMDELECAPALDQQASSMTRDEGKAAFVEDLKVQLDELKVQLQNGLIPSMQPAGRSSIRQDQVGTAGRSSVRQDQLRILEEGLLH